MVEINSELESNPALVNTDPYNAGWLFKLKLSNPEEISSLKSAAEYSPDWDVRIRVRREQSRGDLSLSD